MYNIVNPALGYTSLHMQCSLLLRCTAFACGYLKEYDLHQRIPAQIGQDALGNRGARSLVILHCTRLCGARSDERDTKSTLRCCRPRCILSVPGRALGWLATRELRACTLRTAARCGTRPRPEAKAFGRSILALRHTECDAPPCTASSNVHSRACSARSCWACAP